MGASVKTTRVARAWVPALLLLLGLAGAHARPARADDPFLDEIVSFTPGAQAGFGQTQMPAIVQGPPEGAGELEGSLDVLALGNGGEIVVRFTESVICDGDGIDFTIFENAFHAGSPSGPVFAEVGIVAVSQDGETFVEFPYDAEELAGFAGLAPVYSSSQNEIDPLDPDVSGGDLFDLATVGLEWAAYVRITDPGNAITDPGNIVPPGNSAGFDLDAMALINGCVPSTSTSTTTVTATSTTLGSTTTTSVTTSTSTSTTSTTIVGPEACGDGGIGPEEECDDGDTVWVPGDACDAGCAIVVCGDPDDSGTHAASDALYLLRVAIGSAGCAPCVCDVDGSGGAVTASDALRLLRLAVGLAGVAIDCPVCSAETEAP